MANSFNIEAASASAARSALKRRFIPTSDEVNSFANSQDMSRKWARNELIRRKLSSSAVEATTVEQLRDVFAAAMLLVFVNNDPD